MIWIDHPQCSLLPASETRDCKIRDHRGLNSQDRNIEKKDQREEEDRKSPSVVMVRMTGKMGNSEAGAAIKNTCSTSEYSDVVSFLLFSSLPFKEGN